MNTKQEYMEFTDLPRLEKFPRKCVDKYEFLKETKKPRYKNKRIQKPNKE